MTTVYKHDPSKSTKTHTVLKSVQMRPLASFAARPTNIRFETQEEEEIVELFLRQHPIVNLPWIILTGFLIIAPTILFPIFLRIIPVSLPTGYIIIATAFWYVATFGFALTNFLQWFFNIFIVTNERIVDIDFKFLLYKHFSQAELNKVQDISFTASGIAATLFNYGNVNVETAGEMPTIEFEMVPRPQVVVETIRSLAENTKSP
jgi:hypothetical protein